MSPMFSTCIVNNIVNIIASSHTSSLPSTSHPPLSLLNFSFLHLTSYAIARLTTTKHIIFRLTYPSYHTSHFILPFPIHPVFSHTEHPRSAHSSRYTVTTNLPINSSMTILGYLLRYAGGYDGAEGSASPTQTWLTEITFNPGEEKSEQRTVEYNTYITKHIQQWMRENTIWLYVNHPRSAAVIAVEILSTRVLQFIHPHFLPLLQYCERTITDSV